MYHYTTAFSALNKIPGILKISDKQSNHTKLLLFSNMQTLVDFEVMNELDQP